MSQTISAHPKKATADLTDAERHRLLGDQRRQELLDALTHLDDQTNIETLARTLAEHNPDQDADDAETMRRLKVSLHHQHLPMMDSFGVLDYDPDTKEVSL